TLRPGETREGVDIRLARSPAYCIEGVLETGLGPGEVTFNVSETRPNSGVNGEGAMYTARPGGKTGPDGKFRICDLHPGDYELEAAVWKPDGRGFSEYQSFSTANFTIKDEDLPNIRAQAQAMVTVPGEVFWDTTVPDKLSKRDANGDTKSPP